ncbi:hypothetical protein [Sphingobium boeckii]|uniref:Porin n=1 Tax=Sphingobium boeckii TaxID=1082345 RepID=A0A7W9AJN3_9SPHN|nr:hypothetical protein [Sphingobium boeckii]MBB5686649.1 hypothetical protein [Sphingobium boeckii]
MNIVAGLLAVTAAGLLPQAAWAAPGDVILRIEGMGGVARDKRPLSGSDTDFSGGVLPSVGFRIGNTLQVQADAMIADHLGDTIWATAGHIGVKPSAKVSVGVYGAYAHLKSFEKLDTYRIGAEAVYHADRVSLSGIAGYEHNERATAIVGVIPGFTVVDDYGRKGNFFSMADISFYPRDSWSLTAGHRYIGGRHAAALGTEKSLSASGSGFTLFAEGRIGNAGYAAAWAGIRLRFGSNGVSLRDQDRNSGYANRLKDELFGASNTRRRGQVALPPPPPPPPPAGGCGGCGGSYCT